VRRVVLGEEAIDLDGRHGASSVDHDVVAVLQRPDCSIHGAVRTRGAGCPLLEDLRRDFARWERP